VYHGLYRRTLSAMLGWSVWYYDVTSSVSNAAGICAECSCIDGRYPPPVMCGRWRVISSVDSFGRRLLYGLGPVETCGGSFEFRHVPSSDADGVLFVFLDG
jgi:hypothetical protein